MTYHVLFTQNPPPSYVMYSSDVCYSKWDQTRIRNCTLVVTFLLLLHLKLFFYLFVSFLFLLEPFLNCRTRTVQNDLPLVLVQPFLMIKISWCLSTVFFSTYVTVYLNRKREHTHVVAYAQMSEHNFVELAPSSHLSVESGSPLFLSLRWISQPLV